MKITRIGIDLGDRTALVNQMRGLLADYGLVSAQGIERVRQACLVCGQMRTMDCQSSPGR